MSAFVFAVLDFIGLFIVTTQLFADSDNLKHTELALTLTI